MYDVYRTTGEGTKALAATFLDRFVGLITLCLLALAVAPTFLGSGERPALASLGVLTVILAIALTVLFSRRAARPFRFLLRPFDALGLAARVRAGYEAIYLYRHRWPELGKALVISVMVQAARVVMHYQTALAVDVRTDLRNFFLLIPLVAVFIALPISLNGIGVREGTGIVLFSRVGVDQQGAFGLLFLAYMAGVIVSLAGGVLFALRGRRAARAGNPPAWGEGPRGSSDAPTAGMPS